ncbi:hypothetical protein DYBT9275_06084 [Dyadobacter sp. CECT 9275]|uniref:Uncharacterized protein n=1 Tax=Dyadobacter helix TaxID=2822344 RepID=A0A916NEC9_9BACT|nr:hypothetical protein DYBT9275_06084 [Dyadobacter sp. CECT 9275]
MASLCIPLIFCDLITSKGRVHIEGLVIANEAFYKKV